MPNEELVGSIKNIVGLAKAGKSDDAYAAYRNLFASAAFATYGAPDQRQALKLMILSKGIPTFPGPAIVEAHRAAIGPLRALVNEHNEPADHELLGLCYVRVDDGASAQATFQKGLDLERARDPQSPLCGQLMKHVASV